MIQAAQFEEIVKEFPNQMQDPVRSLVEWLESERNGSRADYSELKQSLQRLTDLHERVDYQILALTKAHARSEERLTRLESVVEKLAEVQTRTDQQFEKLAAQQARTDERLAEFRAEFGKVQARTDQQFEKLASQQVRTDERVTRLEERMDSGFKALSDQIAALGARWGIYNEGTFRATIQGLLSEIEGVEIQEGYYGDRQVDVVVRNGEHVILEITSRMHEKDIGKLYQSADDYHAREGVEPKLMVATSYISPRLMQKIMGLERSIEIFSYEAD